MNVLFLTLLDFDSLQEHNIYTDLLREFVKNGHKVCAISPVEKRKGIKTHIIKEKDARILKLQIGNTQKTNVIEKGISTVMIEPKFKWAISHYFSKIKFDLVLYTTPPITLVSAVEYVKKRDNAKTYLLLKDIFPQNAVDMGMMSTTGLKGFLYKHFRKQEKKLYAISDRIGCMSQANVDYVVKHNPEVDPKKVEVCPNSIEVIDKSIDENTRKAIREKYGIPLDKKVFVYGGNLGKPQGIPFLIKCLHKCKDLDDVFFLIVGDGTEYGRLENYVNKYHQKNLRLMKRLPKEDYDTLIAACDVGMIFLDHRFTIPNFPSRLLSYMQAKLPVLAVTDPNTDIGKVIVDGGFGWWCESNDITGFYNLVRRAINTDLSVFKENSYTYLCRNYLASNAADIVLKSVGNKTRCVGIIAANNIRYSPYVFFYTHILDEMKVRYELIYPERSAVKDNWDGVYHKLKWNNKLPGLINYAVYSMRVKKIINRQRYDTLVVLTSPNAVYLALYLNRKYKNKCIIDIRDYTYEYNKAYALLQKISFNATKYKVISSRKFQAFLPKSKYLVAHNVSVDGVRPQHFVKADKMIIIGYIGSIGYKNNVKKLIDLVEKDDRFCFYIYGKGPDSDEIKEKIYHINSDRIKCFGLYQPSEKASIIESVDILFNAYGNDSLLLTTALSNKLYEGMYYRKAILNSPGTYMEKLSSICGYSLDLNNEHSLDDLYNWYMSLDPATLEKYQDDMLESVYTENNNTISSIQSLFTE